MSHERLGPWGRIPADMRELPQWVLAGADKAPMAAAPGRWPELRNVSVTRPGEWMTFEQAVALAIVHCDTVTTCVTSGGATVTRKGLDLGFVLHEADPFTCIDLDTKDATTHPDKPAVWTTAAEFDRHVSIVRSMDSYTERSRSGKGVHVWVRGAIGRGFHRGNVEVYSQERYIIMTGDVYVDRPIEDRDKMLVNMVAQMRPKAQEKQPLDELEPHSDDWHVFATAAQAANNDKFWALWRGGWQDLGYGSQSDADLALMSMFTFYSDSNAQCRRLFRDSALGRREKATKDDRYVNLTLRLIRARQASERDVEINGIVRQAEFEAEQLAAAVARAQGGAAPARHDERVVHQLTELGRGDPEQPPPPSDGAVAQLAPVPAAAVEAGGRGLPWPPGFVGTLARFVYSNSYLPIKEVSLVAALGLMAGLCGKAWHIPQSGLNLYVILVARSAIGKEAMHTAIATLVNACQPSLPQFGNFVDFSEYVSGPALVKACLANNSFVNVSGEWGRRLRRLADEDGREGPSQTLRTQMTNLYQKSGPQSIAGGLGYSSADASVASVAGVAYSMIGESTPGAFYEALTESMMEDGFLSRFLIVGYDGDRPELNPELIKRPDDALRDALNAIAGHAYAMNEKGESQQVGRDEAAAAVMDAFSRETHDMIRGTEDESRRQMWNRAALKAFRVAALLAVGDHYISPVIRVEHINWAILLVRQDIAMMSKRLEQGDVGSGDLARERKLVAMLREYITGPQLKPSYRVPPRMQRDGIVPKAYLQARTQRVASFYKHKLGSNRALDEALSTCVSNGWLIEVKHDKVVDGYNHHGKAYRIVDLPDYVA